MLTVNVVGFVNTRVMVPCTTILLAFSAVSRVCDDVKIAGLTASIRTLIMRIWQIVTIMFSFMLGTQSVIASSADNLAAKTVKFAIGSLIPMAGGVMAEAYNTVKDGLSFVKATAGIGGIIIILLLMLPGIIPLVIYKLSVIILSSLSVMLRLDGVGELFDEVKGIVEIITAIVLYTSLMLIFAIILFTKSQVG
jgi:stage III sporulation protein AE